MPDVSTRRLPVYGEAETLLKTWASQKGLVCQTFNGDQREPECVVVVKEPGSFNALVRETSMDNVEVACLKLVHTLRRLGAW